MKSRVYITVVGRPNSGKTTVMKTIVDALTEKDIKNTPVWGIDGPPKTPPEFEQKRLKAVSHNTEVIVTEHQVGRVRQQESIDDFRVRVYADALNVKLAVTVAGHTLTKSFGETPVAIERARSIAARFAAELAVDVEDEIRSTTAWEQKPHYNPTAGM